MNVRKVLLGWVLYVPATTAIYALFFNGQFGNGGGDLPAWLIAATSVMAAAAMILLIYWVHGRVTGQISRDRARDISGFFWMIVLTGAIGDGLAIAAEVVFGGEAVWLMIPISTITWVLCVVWIYHRYFKPAAAVNSNP